MNVKFVCEVFLYYKWGEIGLLLLANFASLAEKFYRKRREDSRKERAENVQFLPVYIMKKTDFRA